ncbi:MAG TPA: DUF4337 domain-containing protein [Bacteroidia bacterium]|nr:DUF4337 domain-containing protein [Bacteroidia bacterium]
MNEQERAEIHEEVKADILEKEKADKEKTKWLNYLSITTILIALCATLSTYMGGNHSSTSMQSQIQASDQWAFFQSKSIKEYLYSVQIDNLKTELLTTQPGAAYDSITKHISEYSKSVAKYKTEKDQIGKDAKQLEAVRDDSQKHGSAFGLAVVFLEVSILLSSIAGLLKAKQIWYVSMVPGLIGIIYFINGFLLFF